MEKYLITGFSGFVAKHFIEYLEKNNISAFVLGTDLVAPEFNINNFKSIKCKLKKLDLLNEKGLNDLVDNFNPDYILHLASHSSVKFSWENPTISFRNNTNIFLNLLESVRKTNITCRILSVGSSEEYGKSATGVPLKEETILKPLSPYAVARVSQELLSKIYVEGLGLDVVMTRSFNHLGPGQKSSFVIASIAKQLIEIKKGKTKNKALYVGNIHIKRDFLDVRDVVDAYYKLLKKGGKGKIYNVCSGKSTSLENIINMMCKILDLNIEIKINPELIRPNEIDEIVGSNEKIKRETGWINQISLENSLKDVLSYWTTI
ncbi:hypothetical protein A2230_00460 [candidate division WOR-1 bacterium RIFOXYA2_FULL_36_21]|uniref:NAD(P)-binding domain-containing protein n=1 Tax=candidate division WOR-1 bacterium RIFOXYB2_FULL_36_35 TaxID=1802578 RepID=A0A1F4S5F6_UNCSA|nr:MAG: hypothetical protein A2230_00460 [candidate division WOR-1 bacterium RIFOXYA2_FULL_36_21]OGC15640.1 MAG: hypothetical protein A2290_06160 [candidate division WOR-1 bacterium RIFOXYB2_FULL_36_35]OGC16388.1 MAG: hypothetical protein A2282_00505 [candidate division WOR-1 bacterium RIFOXYA12_FULL_36_13]